MAAWAAAGLSIPKLTPVSTEPYAREACDDRGNTDRADGLLLEGELERRTYGWLSIIILCLCPSANASSSVLWQIGKFDDSSSEFAHPGRWLQAGRVVYVVGKSTPGKDWPFFQPGSANGKDGDRPHPYEIAFNLDGTPRGLYTLKVGLLVENPRLSRLEVEVNGHPALFYQHPQLNYAGGDRPLVVDPIASADTITTDIPTQYLKDGANTLVLTAIDEPSSRDDVIRTGLVYDAVELITTRGKALTPTIVQHGLFPRSSTGTTLPGLQN